MNTVGDLFRTKPQGWGLRGDPFLWRDLARVFRQVPLPDSADTLKEMFDAAFLALTARPISTTGMFHVDRYAHGGMSSGLIAPEFWRQRGFPLLLSRYIAQQATPGKAPQNDASGAERRSE